jgi:hypothetical protein
MQQNGHQWGTQKAEQSSQGKHSIFVQVDMIFMY